MTTTTERVARLMDVGMAEPKARRVAANAQHEKLLEKDINVGGALTMADDMPETRFAMRPALARGQLVTLTAKPSAGKSTLAAACSFAFALRRPLGPLVPDSEGRAYYVSVEDFTGTGLRLQGEAIRWNLTSSERANLDGRLRWVHVNAMLRPELIADAIRLDAGIEEVGVVFLDTGPALFTGDDENANTQLQDFVIGCRAFTQLQGAPCTALLWHPTKGAGPDNLVPRGGSSLIGAVDANLTLWREDDVMTLGYTKLRSEHFEPIRFALQPIPLVLPSGANVDIPVAVPISDDTADEHDATVRARRERILVAMVSTDRMTLRDIAQRALGDSKKKSTVQRDLADMTKGKLVEQDPVSHGFTLTTSGKRAAKQASDRIAMEYRNAKDPG